MRLHILFISALLLSLVSVISNGQSTAVTGEEVTYTYTVSFTPVPPIWTLSGLGEIVSRKSENLTPNTVRYSATVLWTHLGQGTLTLNRSGITLQQWPVEIRCGATPPIMEVRQTVRCGDSSDITVWPTTNGKGTESRWYTEPSGGVPFFTGDLTQAYSTTIQTSTTYFVSLRGMNCESARTPVTIDLEPIPSVPSSFVSTFACGGGPAKLSATPGANGKYIAWYTAYGELAFVGNTFETLVYDGFETYYAATVSPSGRCESNGRIPVSAIAVVNPDKPQDATDEWIYGGSGSVTLKAGSNDPNTVIQWYADGNPSGEVLATGPTYKTPELSTERNYYVRSKNIGGCLSDTTVIKARMISLVSPANVVTDAVRVPNIKTDGQIDALTKSEKTSQVAYLDGLGRTVQTVSSGVTPNGKDYVQQVEYDAYGNQNKTYLPYVAASSNGQFQTNYRTAQAAFYNAGNDKIANDIAPYAVSVFENSPLGRLLEQGAPGASLQPGAGHTKRLAYSFNTGATDNSLESVRRINPDGTSVGFYGANQLNRTVVTDEQGHTNVVFSSTSGQVIVRKQQLGETINGRQTESLDTYSVYDLFGRVTFMIQPKGVAALMANDWNFTSAIKELYTYQFVYDRKGRVVEKKVPGQAWIYYIYDDLDRLVLVQDGFIRTTKKWAFTKYDLLGRIVMQGLYVNSQGRSAVQTMVDGLYVSGNAAYPETAVYESVGSTLHGYTNVSFPTVSATNAELEIVKVNYYDTYDFDRNGSDDFTYSMQNLPGEGTGMASTFALPTGTKYLVIGTSTWLYQYLFYDRYRRLIQVRSNNHLSTSVEDLSTVVYDFEGKTLSKKIFKKAGIGKETSNIERYEYDFAGRLKAVYRPVPKVEKATWTDAVGVEINGNSIRNKGASGVWNSGAFSVNRLAEDEDGWVEFRVNSPAFGKLLGLSSVNGGPGYKDIDYGLFASNSGAKVYVYEQGQVRGSFGTYTAADVFSIERKSGVVYYKKNNQIFYTSTTLNSGVLYADCSMLTAGAELKDVTFFVMEERAVARYEYNELSQLVDKKLHSIGAGVFLQSVDYRYTIHGKLGSINNASLATLADTNEDTDSRTDYFGMEFMYENVESGLNNAAYYNGNISAVKWKGTGAAPGTSGQRSYKYFYDASDRLKSGTYQVSSGGAWTGEANANNEFASYDHNGNILSLQRNQRIGQLHGMQASYGAQTVDSLTYTYSAVTGDQLTSVSDASANPFGFSDGATATTEYTYDVNGNLTSDLNKGISNITYNVLGKPAQITFTDGRRIVYAYDAAGTKLSMRTYRENTLQTTTDYIESFVYENGNLKFYGAREGRIFMNGSNPENQYAIADQQGNTRVLFTAQEPEAEITVSSFEGDYSDNASQLKNVDPAFVVPFVSANHTPSGNRVVKMNQTYKVGPAQSLTVYPGDKVDLEVWEYHERSTGWGTSTTPLSTLITMVAGSFGGVPGAAGESGAIYRGVETAIGAFQPGSSPSDERPAAYFNYILFDKAYNVLDMGFQIAPATVMTRQKMSFNTLSIKEPGFLYVYLSYDDESDNWVYFDDLKITYTPTNVIQYNEYYPYGLQTNSSWARENSKNDYLYNAGSELNQATAWYETFFRGYDPALGRFHQVDPLAWQSATLSVYQYANSNPVAFNDPMGDKPAPKMPDYVNYDAYRPEFFGRVGGGGTNNSWASTWSATQSYGTSDPSEIRAVLEAISSGASPDDLIALGNEGYYSDQSIYKYLATMEGGAIIPGVVVQTGMKSSGPDPITALLQGKPIGFGNEKLDNSYYTERSEFTNMKDLLTEFLSGTGPERSLFWGSHRLTKQMKNSAIVKRGKERYAIAHPDGTDMPYEQIDFYGSDIKFANDIEQFIGSARMSVYKRDGLTIYVLDNTTGIFSGTFDLGKDIPRIPGQITPRGNIYQRFIWIE